MIGRAPPSPAAGASSPASRRRVVATIGLTQTLSWASSYYMPAVLGAPIADGLGLPRPLFFGAFSIALLLSALLSPAIGRFIDQRGGRAVLAGSNVVIAAGLLVLAQAQGLVGIFLGWGVLGLGIGMGLYDPAFATLTRLYGSAARGSITAVTLIAGFASTIGWPASALLAEQFGWRGALIVWAGLNLVVGLPLNWLLIPAAAPHPAAPPASTAQAALPERTGRAMAVLAFFFSATWFVQGAMAAHLPRLLQEAGATPGGAIAAAALVGPAQVAARIVEFSLLRTLHPIAAARIAAGLHPIGAALLLGFGDPALAAFALLHGAGNGMVTIAKGTLPLALFGPVGYGRRSGILSAPARGAQATAPFLFGFLLDRVGMQAAYLSAGLMLAALASLSLLPSRPVPAE